MTKIWHDNNSSIWKIAIGRVAVFVERKKESTWPTLITLVHPQMVADSLIFAPDIGLFINSYHQEFPEGLLRILERDSFTLELIYTVNRVDSPATAVVLKQNCTHIAMDCVCVCPLISSWPSLQIREQLPYPRNSKHMHMDTLLEQIVLLLQPYMWSWVCESGFAFICLHVCKGVLCVACVSACARVVFYSPCW